MNCSDVRDALLAGGALDSEALHAHVHTCDGCRALLEDDRSLGGSLAMSSRSDTDDVDFSAMLGSVQNSIAREDRGFSKAQSLPTPVRTALVAGAMLTLAGIIFAGSRRADFAVYPWERWVGIAGAFLAGAVTLVALSMRGLYRRPLKASTVWTALTASTLLPLAVAHLSYPHSHAASMLGTGADFVPRALGCLIFGVVTAVPVMVVGWRLARNGHRVFPSALFIAAAAGLAGNLMLHIHCPLLSPYHQLAGHVPVLVALVAVYGVWRNRSSRRTPA